MSKHMSEKSGEHRSIAFGVVDGLASNANETGHTSFESRVNHADLFIFLCFYHTRIYLHCPLALKTVITVQWPNCPKILVSIFIFFWCF